MDIGSRLRAARKERKTSVRALAKETGFSASFLSQVELGQTSPSLSSLRRICDALDLELAELLRDPSHRRKPPVVRRVDRQSLRSEWSKATAESLLPDGGDDRFSALLLSLDAGGKTGTWPRRRGAVELAYCIRGKVRLTLGAQSYDLADGDSALLDDGDASWENRGRGRVEVILFSARVS